MIVLAVIGVVALAFIVALILSGKNLTVGQVLLWLGLFLTSLSLLFVSSIVMAAHQKWKSQSAQLQTQIAQAERTRETLTRGNQSVRTVAHQLSTAAVGTGQVWNNMLVENIDANGIVLNTAYWGVDRCVGEPDTGGALEPVPEQPPVAEVEGATDAGAVDGGAVAADGTAADGTAADGTAAPVPGDTTAQPATTGKPHGLQAGMEVFAFREVRVDRLPPPVQSLLFRGRADWASEDPPFFLDEARAPYCRLPLVYLGRFRVGGTADPRLTLVALDDLAPARLELINAREPGLTWSLFEKLPADSFEAFSGADPEQLAALTAVTMQGVDPQRAQGWLTEILSVGSELPPEQAAGPVRVNVRFLQQHTVEVDAAAPDVAATQPFDASGRAISAAYAAGNATVFEVGDEVELDPATAADLIARGIAERVGIVRSRLLREYRTLFQVLADRQRLLNDQISVAQRDLEVLQQSNTKLADQQEALRRELSDLTSDTQGLEREQMVLASAVTALRERGEQLKSQVTELFQGNVRMRQQLAVQQGVE